MRSSFLKGALAASLIAGVTAMMTGAALAAVPAKPVGKMPPGRMALASSTNLPPG